MNDEPGHTVFDDLRSRAAGKRDDRGTEEHRFDHDESEGVFVLNRIEKTARAGEQLQTMTSIDTPDEDNPR